MGSNRVHYAQNFNKEYLFLGMFLQLTSCYIQLMIIVGLCLDGGKSHTSRFLKTRVMQFLGRISMALYLVHEPILFWINFCTYGKVIVFQCVNVQNQEINLGSLTEVPIGGWLEAGKYW